MDVRRVVGDGDGDNDDHGCHLRSVSRITQDQRGEPSMRGTDG